MVHRDQCGLKQLFREVLWVLTVALLSAALCAAGGDISSPELCSEVLTRHPQDRIAQRKCGILLFKNGMLDQAVPILQHVVASSSDMHPRNVAADEDDVVHEYLGAAFSMAARKLGTGSSQDGFVSALRQSNYHFQRAHLIQDKRSRSGSGSTSREPDATNPALVLRSWGDNLMWLNRKEQAEAVWRIGVKMGLWRHTLCRPVAMLPEFTKEQRVAGLSGYIFDADHFSFVMQPLLRALPMIQQELDQALGRLHPLIASVGVTAMATTAMKNEGWRIEAAGLHSGHSWAQLPLMVDGRLQSSCEKWPLTCGLVASVPALRVRSGQVKISMMAAGTDVRPHAGPSNARLRAHCGLSVAPPHERTFLRVGTERRGWQEGSCFVFDESCEHEAHVHGERSTGSQFRAILIADFANPLLETEDLFLSQVSCSPQDKSDLRQQFRDMRALHTRNRRTEEL